MAAYVNRLGEGSGDCYPLCCGQRSILSRAIAAKRPSPSVLRPLWAAWEHDVFCFLRLPALCVLCIPASPGETSEAGPKASGLWDMRLDAALGHATSPYCCYPGWCSVYPEGGELKRSWIWHGSSVTPNGCTGDRVGVEAHVKACCWGSSKKWKQKCMGKVWLTWCC